MIALIFAFLIGLARAERLLDVPPRGTSCWLNPNERHPIDAAPFLRLVPEGIYAACGTERGLIGFAYSRATHFVAFDRDPDVLNYVQLAILLLKLADDGADYRAYMTRPGLLRARLDRPTSRPTIEIEWLRSRLDWWELASPRARFGHFYLTRTGFDSAGRIFADRRYWRDHGAYAKLKGAALDERMTVQHLDLGNLAAVRAFVETLPAGPIAVLDIDSVWLHDRWVGPLKTLAAIDCLAARLRADSVVLTSRPTRPGHFAYGGLTHAFLEAMPRADLLAALERREVPRDPTFAAAHSSARRGWCARWLGQRKSIQ